MYPIELYVDLARDRQATLLSEARASRRSPFGQETTFVSTRHRIGRALIRVGSLLAGAPVARPAAAGPIVATPVRA